MIQNRYPTPTLRPLLSLNSPLTGEEGREGERKGRKGRKEGERRGRKEGEGEREEDE